MVQKDELPLCNQVYVQFVYGGKENSFPSVCGSSLICHEEREKNKTYWQRSAFRNVMENESYDLRKAVVMTTDNVKVYGIIDNGHIH